jgi:Concanavalin A-like lectin/glucanases superfamily
MVAKLFALISLASLGCGGHALEAVELPPAEQALVAHWTFDEGSGDVVYDTSGNNLNGKMTGGEWTQGKFAGGLRFNGADFVTVANFPDATPGWTVSAWVLLGAADIGSGFGTVLSNENINDPATPSNVKPGGWEMHAKDDIDFAFFRDVPRDVDTYGYASLHCCIIEADRWYHIVGVVDPDAKVARLYESGVLQDTRSIPGPILPGDTTFYLGSWNNARPTPTRFFMGTMDEITIYARVLSIDEIRALDRGP